MIVKLKSQLLICLLATTVAGQGIFKSKNVVTKVSPDRLDGVSYALPRTVIQASLSFKRKDVAPGEFEKYAPCFFPKNIAAARVLVQATSFSVDQPTFGSIGEPDPSEHYVAKTKGGYFEDKTMYLEFNEDGVITKGEAESTNVALDITLSAARAIISNAAKGFTPPYRALREEKGFDPEDPRQKFERQLEVDICRGRVIIDAASMVVSLAEAAANTAGDANAKLQAENARKAIDSANLEIDAATENAPHAVENQLTKLSSARKRFDEAEAAARAKRRRGLSQQRLQDVKKARGELEKASSPNNDFLQKVIENATNAKNYSRLAAYYSAQVINAQKAAQAVYDALPRIDYVIRFVGSGQSPAARAFAHGYAEAQKIDERLETLRQQRENLITGASIRGDLSSDALKLLINAADELIASYEQRYFLGTEATDAWTGVFKFRPGKFYRTGTFNSFQTSPVLLVLALDGLCEVEETLDQGVDIKESFKSGSCPNTNVAFPEGSTAFWLTVDRLPDDTVFMNNIAAANSAEERRGQRGFYYRIPAPALVKVVAGALNRRQMDELRAQSIIGRDWTPKPNEPVPPIATSPRAVEKGRNTMKVAQLGVTVSLPASAAGRTTQYAIQFNEATGALKNFKLGSNSLLQKTLIDEASGAASDIIAAKQAREKAKAEATDELTRLKRELDILQTQNLINDEKKKLANAQPSPTP